MQQKEIDIEKIKGLPIFFIVGSPRSGTTLLRSIMDAHPNIMIPLELPFIVYFYEEFKNVKVWDRNAIGLFIEKLYTEITQEYWSIKKWKVSKQEMINSLLMHEGIENFAEICKLVYLNFNSIIIKNEIKIIGDKNPLYSLHIKTLLKLFPNAKFIYIIRDYRDQIQSLQRVDFGNKLTPFSALRWLMLQKKIINFSSRYPENFFLIKYEDLVSSADSNCREIFKFIEIPYHPEVLNFMNQKEKIIAAYKEDQLFEHHSSLLEPINSSRIGNWKKNMPEKEIKMADMVVGKWAERFGYERKYKKVNPLLYLYLLPIYVHLSLQWFIGIFVKMLPHKTRNKVIYKNSIFEKVYEKVYVKLRGL